MILNHSSSVTFIWQIAAGEAVAAGSELIEPEHLLLGILKVGDILDEKFRDTIELKISQNDLQNLYDDLSPIEELLTDFQLNRIFLRRRLRGLIDHRQYKEREKVIHRSQISRQIFRQAEQLAQRHNALILRPIHLLVSLLDNVGETFHRALIHKGINYKDFNDAIINLVIYGNYKRTTEGGRNRHQDKNFGLGNAESLEESVPSNEAQHDNTDNVRNKETLDRAESENSTNKDTADIKKGEEQTDPDNTPDVGTVSGRQSKKLLDRFGVDLTRLAREGRIETLIGRQKELLKIVRTLTRKTKSNPLLIGDAGIGKTAIIKGIAQLIATGNISPALQEKRVIDLNLAALVAGTKYRGEFEDRIVGIIDECRKSPDIILFIDEIHMLIGAGHASGGLDAANILKPALSKGELTCIGATTMDEYRKYFEKDAALNRRFQPLLIEEPSEPEAVTILNGLKDNFEIHHGVIINPDAITAAVTLSARYLTDRRLPDKAIDVLDEACARATVSQLTFRKIEDMHDAPKKLVTAEIVADVVSEMSNQPVTVARKAEQERLVGIEDSLKCRIIGQNEAVERVARIVRMSRSGLRAPGKPQGVFLFLGPTGVGKTELAKALTSFLFGSEKAIIRLDMSEFMEKHSIAKLIGAPPGYVGYEEEGQLTGRLRRQPYAVVLLDEIEKAHPVVLDLFLQLFDEGRITDAKGRVIDGKSAIFVMTSNIGADHMQKGPLGFGLEIEDDRQDRIIAKLKMRIRSELLNRIDDIIIFKPLSRDDIIKIAWLIVAQLRKRMVDQGYNLADPQEDVLTYLAEKGHNEQYGARPLLRVIDDLISIPLSDMIMSGKISSGDQINVSVKGGILIYDVLKNKEGK